MTCELFSDSHMFHLCSHEIDLLRWVTHDACGLPTKEIWPYFSTDDVAIDNLRKDLPVEVSSCWNGVAAFDARWFLPRELISRSLYCITLTVIML